jgi:hypothetical protein
MKGVEKQDGKEIRSQAPETNIRPKERDAHKIEGYMQIAITETTHAGAKYRKSLLVTDRIKDTCRPFPLQ